MALTRTEIDQRYRERHRDRIRARNAARAAYKREWQRAHQDEARAWWAANADRLNAARRAKRALEKQGHSCHQCGSAIPGRRSDAKWCSWSCRNKVTYAAQHPRTERSCATCGRTFKDKRSDARYCSKLCRMNSRPVRAAAKRRRVRRLGNGGSHTDDEWLKKCELFAWRCAYCGERRPLTEDHKTPITRGGSDDISNILPACRPCNSKKQKRTTEEFLALHRSAA